MLCNIITCSTPYLSYLSPLSEVKEFKFSDKLRKQWLNFVNTPVIATTDNITLHMNNRVVIMCAIQFVPNHMEVYVYFMFTLIPYVHHFGHKNEPQ